MTAHKTPAGYFNQGYEARKRGLPHSACQLIFKAWPEEYWQLGWRLADIDAMVSKGNIQEQPLERVLKRPFDQGGVAYLNGVDLNDCPYDPSSGDGLHWQAGWIATKSANQPEGKHNGRGCFWCLYAALTLAVIIIFMWAYYR